MEPRGRVLPQLSALNLIRSYTWGLDIARSLSDAGGVGALLQIVDHTVGTNGTAYHPAFDGNGNIAALVNGGTGAIAATYEYSPFGEPLTATVNDSTVADQPFRFSTKFTDLETGLVYYGRRYYSPSQGRFLGRDPIEEQGGLHLYGFVRNNPINSWDYLGMKPTNPPSVGGEEEEVVSTDASGNQTVIRWVCDADGSEWVEGDKFVRMAPFAVTPGVNDSNVAAPLDPNSGLDPNMVGAALANAPLLAAAGSVSGGAKSTITITGGTATYYNPTGNRAADGSIYDGKGMTAAVNSVIAPLGTVMTVTGTYNGVTNTITVTITDRMPFSSLEKGAVIDLSPAAFNALFGPGTATPSGPGRVAVVVTFPGNNGNQIINLPSALTPAQPANPPGTGTKGPGG